MNFIIENLAVGNYQDALQPAPDIDALLCVAQEHDVYGTPLCYHKVPIIDMQPIPAGQLAEAVAWIKTTITGHKLLVFCNAGIGRSPSVVIAYLCCVLGYGFGNAVEYVATKKPYISILPDLITTIEETKKHFKKT